MSVWAARRPALHAPALGRLDRRLLPLGLLWLLALSLPFEATQRPLVHSGLLTLTNLKLLFYLSIAGAAALALSRRQSILGSRTLAGSLLALFLLAALCAALDAVYRLNALKWTLDWFLAGVFWLLVPSLLRDAGPGAVHRLTDALIAGAVLAAIAGLFEVTRAGNVPFLALFHAKPTTVGTTLRLSGTFEYANIAGGYLAIVLPFAVASAIANTRNVTARRLAGVASLVLIAALLLTSSRGALLGLAGGLAVFVVATRHSFALSRRTLLAGFALVIIVAGAGAVYLGGSALRLTTESDVDWYRAAFQAQTPAVVRPGTILRVPLAVRNLGTVTWTMRGRTPYHLSYHWLLPSGRVAVFEGSRTPLPQEVMPGRQVSLMARLITPPHPGHYRLVWDMVVEHVAWFSVKTGQYSSVPVRVTGRTGSAPTPHAGGHAPSRLPTAPATPGRGALWAAAVRMSAAHPLLGVGPDGYRLVYGQYARPRQSQWDQRIFANSVPLELAADLGLPGLLLFAVFLLAAIRRVLPAVRSGTLDPRRAALPAALAAFLAHGSVDYLLGAHAIFILFWLLLTLIAATSWNSAKATV